MKPYKEFETERLIMKPTLEGDAPFIHALMNTPKWILNIGDRNIKTHEDARKYILEKIMPQYGRLGFSNYTLVRKSDDTKIGSCGLYDRVGLEGLDIGFAFLPAYEGQGYGFEAANKILTLAFNDFDINEVNAITNMDNIASQNLLEKLGLRKIGTVILPDEDEELFKYSITRSDWK